MADILTLADARAALNIPDDRTNDDAELQAFYIPATTRMVEQMAGPLVNPRTYMVRGGKPSAMLPTRRTGTATVTAAGVTIPTTDDGTGSIFGIGSNLPTGPLAVTFVPAPSDSELATAKLAARIILVQLWRSDQQGFRPAYGSNDDVVSTPYGFAVPKRAAEVLASISDMPGFA